ncbi:DUF4913 domain-containing protein [Aldersonia sp. NBC_00410]|uniref:DUF4913 domain-containing protein n=1 Tax=Aldersonia sp. NBC_00410 TaxID=2975954 RepID=UPI0022573908|nr:DUF4913 domain-containing protein [Aldersonia sp. NBC_00410]MCX5042492.1 DUF4913 domain-containing protein [Aldersonia sp. NBC_00410]
MRDDNYNDDRASHEPYPGSTESEPESLVAYLAKGFSNGRARNLGVPEGTETDKPAPRSIPPRFRHAGEWVEQWLAPIVVRRLTGPGQGRTWCAQWWKHDEVAVRMDALWSGWEAARASKDRLAMSALWVHHIDAHLRVILDGESGPLHMCGPDEHNEPGSLPVEPAPQGWFEHGRHRDTRLIPAGPNGSRG